jgi:transcriptional regulator with XRE-family HTH domain
MTNVEQVIADFFKLARSHKIRAYQIANEAGITRVTLSNWKSNRTEPQLGAWMAANEALYRLVKQKLIT